MWHYTQISVSHELQALQAFHGRSMQAEIRNYRICRNIHVENGDSGKEFRRSVLPQKRMHRAMRGVRGHMLRSADGVYAPATHRRGHEEMFSHNTGRQYGSREQHEAFCSSQYGTQGTKFRVGRCQGYGAEQTADTQHVQLSRCVRRFQVHVVERAPEQ